MTQKIIKIGLLLTLTFFLNGNISSNTTFAEETKEPVYYQVEIPKPELIPGVDPSKVDKSKGIRNELVMGVLPRFALSLISFVGALTVLFLVIGAVRYMTTYGKEEAAENAKKQIMFSLIGFLLAIMSYTIVKIIINLDFGEDTVEKNLKQMTNDAIEDSSDFDPKEEPDYNEYDYGL